MEKFPKSRRGRHAGGTRQGGSRIAAALLVFIFASTFLFVANALSENIDSAAVFSAKLSLPQGGGDLVSEQLKYLSGIFKKQKATAANAKVGSSVVSTTSQAAKSAGVSSASASKTSSAATGSKAVQTLQMGTSSDGTYETYAGISVQSLTTQHQSADKKSADGKTGYKN